ncbi:PucR family transcriptional regulator [Desulfosporosinus burensis]
MSESIFKVLGCGKQMFMRKIFEDSDLEADTLYDEFLEIIINGGGYQGITDYLAQKLQVNILIENEYFLVLARSYYDTPTFSNTDRRTGIKYWKPQHVDPRIVEYVRLLQSTHQPVTLPELPEYGITSPRMVFPIIIKGEITKYLNIFKENLNREQMRIVRVVMHSLVVLEICRQAQVDLEDRYLKNLIFGLIFDDKGQDHNFYEKENLPGFDLSREAVLTVIQINAALGKRQMEGVLRSIISDLSMNASAVAISEEQAVLLIQSSDGSPLETAVITEYLQALFEALKMTFTNCKIKIGVGRQCYNARDYKVALNESFKALSFTDRKLGSEEGVIYYHSLKLMECLMQPGNEQTLSGFVQSIIGNLYAYGVKNNINLIDTLESYLNHNCCIQSAARELFIHPNSLRYRLEKAGKISGLDLTDNDTKLELQLAIKLYRYQGDLLLEM